eukprot:1606818-Alexandrium_andersonii.AAC.1
MPWVEPQKMRADEGSSGYKRPKACLGHENSQAHPVKRSWVGQQVKGEDMENTLLVPQCDSQD